MLMKMKMNAPSQMNMIIGELHPIEQMDLFASLNGPRFSHRLT
jgi:hypothetical protein